MIDEAFAPGSAKGVIVGAGQQRGVFAGDVALIVVAIEGPGLQLAAA